VKTDSPWLRIVKGGGSITEPPPLTSFMNVYGTVLFYLYRFYPLPVLTCR